MAKKGKEGVVHDIGGCMQSMVAIVHGLHSKVGVNEPSIVDD